MRQLSELEFASVSGGEIGNPDPRYLLVNGDQVQVMDTIVVVGSRGGAIGDPNGCSSAILGATGWGGAIGAGLGGLLGSVVPVIGTVFGAGVGAYLGLLLGGTSAGGYVAANNPACGPKGP